MTVTFKRHGGVHEWNLTEPQVWEAIYVSLEKPVILLEFLF